MDSIWETIAKAADYGDRLIEAGEEIRAAAIDTARRIAAIEGTIDADDALRKLDPTFDAKS